MELQTLFRRESAAKTFLLETDQIARPLFPGPNNGAAFVPESENQSCRVG
jgi:hypothetical protein